MLDIALFGCLLKSENRHNGIFVNLLLKE